MPRASLGVVLLAAMLTASPLAQAQRASLADRVAALEARGSGEQNGAELVNQIAQLRAEVQNLRGQLEEAQQALEQAKQSQRAQYLDLSGRLDRLEGVPASGEQAPVASANPPAVAAPPQPAASAAPSSMAGMDERSAYNHAFDALKGGDYVESSRRLRDFLATFPGGRYAPNALYWLGESYYVTQNYALAAEQFQGLLDRFPTDDKAPGALLKLGLSQYGLKQYERADATLRAVIARHPGTDIARTAEDRLRSMQLAGAR
ncbi:tol-pal system protein YbgF [Thermomonas brevis]